MCIISVNNKFCIYSQQLGVDSELDSSRHLSTLQSRLTVGASVKIVSGRFWCLDQMLCLD